MTVTCFHVFTKLQGIQEAPLPLLSSDTLWVHSEELKTSLSNSFHLGSLEGPRQVNLPTSDSVQTSPFYKDFK